MKDSFLSLYSQGKAKEEDLDKFRQAWLDDESCDFAFDSSKEFHAYLGFTWNEYISYSLKEKTLDEICKERKSKKKAVVKEETKTPDFLKDIEGDTNVRYRS